jgi:hypothetical protein
MSHLWEIKHPYYAPDGYANECESFEQLRHDVDRIDEDMNHIYRWDWYDPQQPHNDDLFLPDEYRPTKQRFTVHMVQPRKSSFINFWCWVTPADEPAVLEWLQGPRVLGALRTLWEPIIPGGES